MQRTALLVGNSDGIGLATTKRLLASEWKIIGISRSGSPIVDTSSYRHLICDVGDPTYPAVVDAVVREGAPDLCIYFVGIGEFFDPQNMTKESRVIDVNLTGMVKTAAAVLPGMIQRGEGHFIGISSFADELSSSEAPSYFASKAGFSSYLRGLSTAVRPKGVFVTNIRFGFVDTKMAKGDFRPLMAPGDLSKMPTLPSFPEGWHLGKPDLILEMPAGYDLPASGPDIFRNFVVPTNLAEDKWVRAIEFRPSARKVVHHVLFAYDSGGSFRKQDGADGRPGFNGAMAQTRS